MAIEDFFRAWRQLAISREDWHRAAGSEEFGDYLRRARERFLHGQAATVRELRLVYRRAAARVREDIQNAGAGTLRQRHLLALERALERRARQLTPEILDATRAGIHLAVLEAVNGPEQLTLDLLGGVFEQAAVRRLFAGINERAVLAILARTGRDGLKLSDRVWRIGERWRAAARRLVEDGVARGLDPRKLAREVERYLQPGVHTTLKAATRRRLKVPKDVSMEAMRLAVTEMQHSFHEGAILANRAAPSYQGSFWRLSESHPIADVCDEYAGHNGNGFWLAGEEPAKPHPWCMCVLVPSHEPPEQFTERLRRWMGDPSSEPRLEEWYTGTVKPFVSRPLLAFAGGGSGGGSGSGGAGGGHPVDRLLMELADTGRDVTPVELQQIREHAAAVGFPPTLSLAGGRAAGLQWQGRILSGSDRLTPAEKHYLEHAVHRREWPEGTTLDDYLNSIHQVVLDESTGMALTRYKGMLQASFLRHSVDLRGPDGEDWVLVEYRAGLGHIVTAYQPRTSTMRNIEGRVIRWLSRPR